MSKGGETTIREATSAGVPALCALVGDMEHEAFELAAFGERLSAQRAGGLHTCLVCERGGAVLGMLNLRIEDQLHHARPAAEIMELVVADGHRGEGLGAALLEHARRLAAERGCEVLEVTSKMEREAAHRFYERMGMRKTHYRLSMTPGERG